MLALTLFTIGLIISAGVLVFAEQGMKLKIYFNKNIAIGELSEKSVASQLAERSPFSLKMTDFNGHAKIAILPYKLDLNNAQRGFTPEAGDIAIDVPLGTICIFFHNENYSDRLIKLGCIISGLKSITDQNKDFIAEWMIGK